MVIKNMVDQVDTKLSILIVSNTSDDHLHNVSI